MNLLEKLNIELNRARELRAMYEDIPGGGFGTVAITLAIHNAETAITDGDLAAMAHALNALEVLEYE